MIPLLVEDPTEQLTLVGSVLDRQFDREGMNILERRLAISLGVLKEFDVIRLLLMDHLEKNGFTTSGADSLLKTLQDDDTEQCLLRARQDKQKMTRIEMIVAITNELIIHLNSLNCVPR